MWWSVLISGQQKLLPSLLKLQKTKTIILGAGVHASNGLKRGVVVNIDATVMFGALSKRLS